MKPIFSIIVPAYNVAAFIRECLDSALWQECESWECICVDDGSTDGTSDILDEYAANDKRFRIVHQANAGVSAARNAGMKIASGEWLLFLDGDDILMKGALSQLVRIIDSSDCDGIATWPIYRRLSESSSEWSDVVANLNTTVEPVADRKLFLLGDRAILGYPHGRIYRRSLFSSVEFPVGVPMMEDFRHWVMALTIDAKWVMADGSYYGYRHRKGSTLASPNLGYYLAVLEMPMAISPVLRQKLHITDSDMKTFWSKFKHSYTYFIHLFSHFWAWMSQEDQQRIIISYSQMCETIGRCPADIFSRIQMRFLCAGFGARTDWLYQHIEVFIDRYVRKERIGIGA